MISNMQHTSSFAGTATLKKLKQLSEFIIIISEKKILLTSVTQNPIP